MLMIHIAHLNLNGAFFSHRNSLSYILDRVGDAIQSGAVVSGLKDFLTIYSI